MRQRLVCHMFVNRNPDRGVALFIDKDLKAREVDNLNSSKFKESVWCTFNSPNEGRILIGCVYRNGKSTEENNNELFKMFQSDEVANYNKICIVGDFNYPFVKWNEIQKSEKAENVCQNIEDSSFAVLPFTFC